MQERICPNCRYPNYSSNVEGTWHCWNCGSLIGPECAVEGISKISSVSYEPGCATEELSAVNPDSKREEERSG